jgi:hypothetical protein
VKQAVLNPQRDIAPGERYEIYIGAAHEHDGKTDDKEQRRQLGQIAKIIAALLTGLRWFGSFKQFKYLLVSSPRLTAATRTCIFRSITTTVQKYIDSMG